MKKTLLCLTAIAASLSTVQAAEEWPPLCEIRNPSCSAPSYDVLSSRNGRCSPGQMGPVTQCLGQYEPPSITVGSPGEVLIDCYYGYGAYSCQALPYGENVTLTWSTSGRLAPDLGNTGGGSYNSITCTAPWLGGGQLTVTVTSPYGLSSSASVMLPCRTLQVH